MRTTIRPSTENDISALIRIHLESFKVIGVTKEKAKDWFEKNLKNTYSLESGGKVVGYYSFWPSDRLVHLNWYAVSKKFRGKGLGDVLLKDFLKRAKKLRAKEVMLYTRNRYRGAMLIYIRNGFDVTGINLHTDGELMLQLKRKL